MAAPAAAQAGAASPARHPKSTCTITGFVVVCNHIICHVSDLHRHAGHETRSDSMTQPETVPEMLAELAGASAEDVLADAAKRFPGRVAFASSLGLEDQVLTAMIAEAKLDIPIFTLDTGRLYPETYDLIDRTSERYGVTLHVYFPAAGEVEEMVDRDGVNLFRDSIEARKRCCEIRKVRPLRRAQRPDLADLAAALARLDAVAEQVDAVAVDHLLDLAGGGEVRVQRHAVALAGAVDQVVGLGVEAPCVEREDRDVELGLGDHRREDLVFEPQRGGEGDAAGEALCRVGEHVFGGCARELGEHLGNGLRLRHGVTPGLVSGVSMQITNVTNNMIAYYDEAGDGASRFGVSSRGGRAGLGSRGRHQEGSWTPAASRSDRQRFPADLLIHLLEQVAAHGAAELRVVEELGGARLVLIHEVDEQALQLLVEDQLEGLERVGRRCLLQRLVGDGLLADLAEEELVCLGERSAEALVDDLDEGREFDLLLTDHGGAHLGGPVERLGLVGLQLDLALAAILQAVVLERDLVVEAVPV